MALGKLTPDFKTIADFRKDNKEAIKKGCKEFILLCNRLNLLGGELIAIDSSKFKAVNSKKRNFNEAKLKKALEKIDEKIEEYFTELEDNDKKEAHTSHCSAEDIKKKIEILKVEKLVVLADKGYYDAIEIKECVDNGVVPYIPEPESTIPEDVDIYHKDEFSYDTDKDCYICPQTNELTYRGRATHHGRVMKLYKSKYCKRCPILTRCTRNKQGRIIYRWEHEEVLEEMRERVRRKPDTIAMRNILTEHIFGTMKRGFNQGYMLLKGKEKVSTEISLTVLSYNIKRVLNIIGLDRLKEEVLMGSVLKNKIAKRTKESFSYTLRFLYEKVNKILSLIKFEFTFHTVCRIADKRSCRRQFG